MKGLLLLWCVVLGLTLSSATGLAAQSAHPQAADLVVTQAEHNERVAVLKNLLAACVADATLCKPESVGPDERVQVAGGSSRVRLEWLRQGLLALASATGDQRSQLANSLSLRLARLAVSQDALPPAQLQQARSQVDQVLATKEFRQEPAPTWIERQWRAFVDWLDRIFGKSFDAVSEAPRWLKYFFQALLFLAPAVLLLLWLMRQVREDRIRPTKLNDVQGSGFLAPPNEWLHQADEFARLGDWRQAIHALYWATIAGFEKRRVWRTNRTRTPREYLRLLAPGSQERSVLTEQTRLFELTWYGYRSASTEDYARAVELQSHLEAR